MKSSVFLLLPEQGVCVFFHNWQILPDWVAANLSPNYTMKIGLSFARLF
jgi:hypothetical protein